MNFNCVFDSEKPAVTKVSFFSSLEELFAIEKNNYLFITDTNIYTYYGKYMEKAVILSSGESAKNWGSLEKIITQCMEFGLGRDGTLVAVGGGVICDMTAFAASIYMRGMQVILIPSTLLAMVDASLGGKTGIDFLMAKNMIGTFYPAEEVRINVDILASLPVSEYRNGLAELIKHGLLSGGDILHMIQLKKEDVLSRDALILTQLVYRSLMVKKQFIEQDPKETKGIRAALNLGHTFGHALERVTHFTWSHGEAVAWGISRALHAGVALKITDENYCKEVDAILKCYGYDIDYRITDVDKFLNSINFDKKKRKGQVKFILQPSAGSYIMREIETQLIKEIVSV